MCNMFRIELLKKERRVDHHYYWQMWFKYHTAFFGNLIFKGNKIKAFNNFLKIKQLLKRKEMSDPYYIFLISMMKITPEVFFTTVKLGGGNYSVPMPITEKKKIVFAIKWALKLLRDKYKVLKIDLVSNLLVDALYGEGLAMEQKKALYKIATRRRHLLKFFE